jgi:hypothetical protein
MKPFTQHTLEVEYKIIKEVGQAADTKLCKYTTQTTNTNAQHQQTLLFKFGAILSLCVSICLLPKS